MFAYCLNNPINRSDSSGQNSEAASLIGEAIKQRLIELLPFVSGAGASTFVDGPLPIVDALAVGLVSLLAIASVTVGVVEGIKEYSRVKEKAKSEEKKKVKLFQKLRFAIGLLQLLTV